MNPGYELKTDAEDEKQPEFDGTNNLTKQAQNKTIIPLIAGILLIISGSVALLFSITIITIDISMIESTGILEQLQKVDPSITAEQARSLISTCYTIVAVLSVFPILGGVLSLKRKLWGIIIGCSIIGLSTFLFIIPGIFSLIALILLVVSRKELH